jgi:hypothetical protein
MPFALSPISVRRWTCARTVIVSGEGQSRLPLRSRSLCRVVRIKSVKRTDQRTRRRTANSRHRLNSDVRFHGRRLTGPLAAIPSSTSYLSVEVATERSRELDA